MLRADPEDAGPGPLPWLPGIPTLWPTIRAGSIPVRTLARVSALADDVARSARLPRWTARYADVLCADLRRDLAVRRAATGVPADERSLLGPPPHDDSEAAYHRNLTNRISARYGEAIHAWQERIVAYVGHRDDQTGPLANYLNGLERKGVDAGRMLERAIARKPLPVDHPTAALTYRVKDLVARRTGSAAGVDDFRRTTPSTGADFGL